VNYPREKKNKTKQKKQKNKNKNKNKTKNGQKDPNTFIFVVQKLAEMKQIFQRK